MTWLPWVLLGLATWLLLSMPLAILLGSAIRKAEYRELGQGRDPTHRTHKHPSRLTALRLTVPTSRVASVIATAPHACSRRPRSPGPRQSQNCGFDLR
jgi:hypothetical protein